MVIKGMGRAVIMCTHTHTHIHTPNNAQEMSIITPKLVM